MYPNRCRIDLLYARHFTPQIVQVRGNLKLRLSISKNIADGSVEFVEPSVIGFVGECHVVEYVSSILEVSIPHSTFTLTRSLDMKRILSIESRYILVLGA